VKQLPPGYTLNGVIGAILDAAQLLLDVAGLIKDRRSGLDRDGSAGLVLLNIHANRQSLAEQVMEQGQRGAQNGNQASRERPKSGAWQG
jgi:hypothetical protein